MKLKKLLIEDKTMGYIYDKKSFDPDNPMIVISGIGTMKLDTARKIIYEKIEKCLDDIKSGRSMQDIEYSMFGKYSVINIYIKAVADVERELETPQMKRKISLIRKKSK